jgi:hypothetical protein
VSKGPKVNEELKALKTKDYELLPLRLPLSTIRRFLEVITKGGHEAETAGKRQPAATGNARTKSTDVCVNAECRLRKAGCKGFEGCPGFKARG